MLKGTKIIIFKGKISNRNALNSQKPLGSSRDAFQGGDLLLYEERSQSGMNSLCFFRLRVWCVREEKVLCINYVFLFYPQCMYFISWVLVHITCCYLINYLLSWLFVYCLSFPTKHKIHNGREPCDFFLSVHLEPSKVTIVTVIVDSSLHLLTGSDSVLKHFIFIVLAPHNSPGK